jgi:UDP-glucose 4-epimerase
MASSAAIYGESLQPHLEDEMPAPISPYGQQKLELEGLGRKFSSEQGLETASLRFFNVYGPWQRADSPYSGVIAKFVECIAKGIAPTIFGDGGQLRDFIYVEDVVAALRLAASAPAEQLGDGIFNVATGRSVSLVDLVDVICRITGKSLKPNFEPVRAGDIRVSLAKVGKAEEALGFRAAVSLETGLRRLIHSVTI